MQMSDSMLKELRATKPAAPDGLRERVRAIAATEPQREPFPARLRSRFEWRRLVLVAPVTLVVAVAAAGVIGLTRGDGADTGQQAASGEAASTTALRRQAAPTEDSAKTFGGATAPPPGVVPPSPGRLQRYEAELRLRVADVEALSSATKRAQQIATTLGGHVASLSYDAPAEGVGAAQITLRVPTSRIQSAVAQLSDDSYLDLTDALKAAFRSVSNAMPGSASVMVLPKMPGTRPSMLWTTRVGVPRSLTTFWNSRSTAAGSAASQA